MKSKFLIFGVLVFAVILVSGCVQVKDSSSIPPENDVKNPDLNLPNPGITKPISEEFLIQTEKCKNLSEDECFEDDDCSGEYGPSSCTPDGLCTQDMVFKSCGPSGLTSEEINQIKTECEKINGTINKDSMTGDYECFCKPSPTGRCLENLILELRKN